MKEESILITPVANVPTLVEWNRLFKEAKQKGFDAEKDAEEFRDWNTTLEDCVE